MTRLLFIRPWTQWLIRLLMHYFLVLQLLVSIQGRINIAKGQYWDRTQGI